ncbi:MAG: hypothetical protein ACXACP_00160 [Candidatus Hodarchaeales archaeon]
MQKILRKITEIEWIAQELLLRFQNIGPKIRIVQKLSNKNQFVPSKYNSVLAIQGSFDPPLFSHLELIKRSINLHKEKESDKNVALLLLLSPTHVEKYIDLTTRSLLGIRVLIIDLFLSELAESIDIFIGVSNIPLYIDLTKAIRDLFSLRIKVTYIMGLDVFTKLFHQKYYTEPLKDIFPKLFQSNFYVAGRNEVFTKELFVEYLQKLPNIALQAFQEYKSIQFVNLEKKFRYSNSTEVRTQLADRYEENITLIEPNVLEYLKTHQIYVSNSEITVKQVIIQQIVRLAILDNIGLNKIQKILSRIYLEIDSKPENSLQIISEYKTKENSWLKERYNWLKLHSS